MSRHALSLPLFALIIALPVRESGLHLIMVPWAHPSPQLKRHLDRFSRFAGLTRFMSFKNAKKIREF